MPGAREVLEQVGDFGLMAVVVTGSGQRSLIGKLENIYSGVFKKDRMVTAYDVEYGKPHPEPYLMGLEKAGVKSNEAIVIENAPMGVEAAVAARIFTIAVNTGPLADDVLLNAGADLLYPDMKSLAGDWIKLMNAVSGIPT
jgi:HAD superfamily hydrolase (TIGR01509 family)